MSLQAVKAVEIGRGVTAAESFGSQVHDAIHYAKENNGRPTRFTREKNIHINLRRRSGGH